MSTTPEHDAAWREVASPQADLGQVSSCPGASHDLQSADACGGADITSPQSLLRVTDRA